MIDVGAILGLWPVATILGVAGLRSLLVAIVRDADPRSLRDRYLIELTDAAALGLTIAAGVGFGLTFAVR